MRDHRASSMPHSAQRTTYRSRRDNARDPVELTEMRIRSSGGVDAELCSSDGSVLLRVSGSGRRGHTDGRSHANGSSFARSHMNDSSHATQVRQKRDWVDHHPPSVVGQAPPSPRTYRRSSHMNGDTHSQRTLPIFSDHVTSPAANGHVQHTNGKTITRSRANTQTSQSPRKRDQTDYVSRRQSFQIPEGYTRGPTITRVHRVPTQSSHRPRNYSSTSTSHLVASPRSGVTSPRFLYPDPRSGRTVYRNGTVQQPYPYHNANTIAREVVYVKSPATEPVRSRAPSQSHQEKTLTKPEKTKKGWFSGQSILRKNSQKATKDARKKA